MNSQRKRTEVFLDSGNPEDTREMLSMMGFLDGQTTNPSLVAKGTKVQEYVSKGRFLKHEDLLMIYKDIIQEIYSIIPNGSISIEVYADLESSKDDLLSQANEMNSWIPNTYIKFPSNKAGIEAASEFTKNGNKANMTLCFSQIQAAAIHQAIVGASDGDVYCSSFVGRLFDKGVNGIDLLRNIIKMYRSWGSHVHVLAASFRNFEQINAALALEPEIITFPKKFLIQWVEQDFRLPETDFAFDNPDNAISLEFDEITIDEQNWKSLDIENELLIAGIEGFAKDWNSLIQ